MEVYSYNARDGCKNIISVGAAISCIDQHTGSKYILALNEAMHMKDFANHLICPMLCCLNVVVVNDIKKILVKHPSETIYAPQVANSFNEVHNVIMPSKLLF